MLSLKSEAELVRASESTSRWQRRGGWVLAAGGLALAVVGLVQ